MTREEQLTKLRAWMAEQGLAAYIVPMADAFLSEYVPPHAMRLAWLTGFDGSAGTAVITQDKAILFTDGRYIIQAHQQLDTNLYDVINISQIRLAEWLAAHVSEGNIGYDPALHSAHWVGALTEKELQLTAVLNDPIDGWWTDRPQEPSAAAWEYPSKYAGKPSADKRQQIADMLTSDGADALLISAAENIAWLLNIRGGDLECTPVLQGYALLYKNGAVQLFSKKEKISADLLSIIQPLELFEIGELANALVKLDGKSVVANPVSTPALLVQKLDAAGAIVRLASDPIDQVKAVKNDVELKWMRDVHVRDGAALVKSLAQIDAWVDAGEQINELQVDVLLNENRARQDEFVSLSFPAIVGSGPNGAIVHYRVTEETNRTCGRGELLLIDSGGQYLGGTTDVTRTLAIGAPSEAMKHHYTLVLKGHIALGSATFPVGVTGSQLDVLARQPLWAEGLDYDHGTGHGVGACLGVHEGPQGISKRANSVALVPGMILSNEPGYYPEGKYGIRIENLVEVVEKQSGFLTFANLTMVPYARALIDASMLNLAERDYINHYHDAVSQALSPYLNDAETAWLEEACAAL